MESGSGIYILVNKKNGHRYIGQTVDFHRRRTEHRTKTHQARSVIGRAIRKHGKDAFEFLILERCAHALLDVREIHFIATINPEYNMSDGGVGSKGHTTSQEIKSHLAKTSRAAWDPLSAA